jgi:hypothetical protein
VSEIISDLHLDSEHIFIVEEASGKPENVKFASFYSLIQIIQYGTIFCNLMLHLCKILQNESTFCILNHGSELNRGNTNFDRYIKI